jgi:hypothetical protein
MLHICCNVYVASACSKCFVCFRHVLLFYLSVAKVDLSIGLSNEEERASAGAMAASAKLAVALHRRTCRVMFAHVCDPRVGPHRAAALRLNQRPARLPHHHVRGLLRASSGASKGAPSGQTPRSEQDGHGHGCWRWRCVEHRREVVYGQTPYPGTSVALKGNHENEPIRA